MPLVATWLAPAKKQEAENPAVGRGPKMGEAPAREGKPMENPDQGVDSKREKYLGLT